MTSELLSFDAARTRWCHPFLTSGCSKSRDAFRSPSLPASSRPVRPLETSDGAEAAVNVLSSCLKQCQRLKIIRCLVSMLRKVLIRFAFCWEKSSKIHLSFYLNSVASITVPNAFPLRPGCTFSDTISSGDRDETFVFSVAASDKVVFINHSRGIGRVRHCGWAPSELHPTD